MAFEDELQDLQFDFVVLRHTLLNFEFLFECVQSTSSVLGVCHDNTLDGRERDRSDRQLVVVVFNDGVIMWTLWVRLYVGKDDGEDKHLQPPTTVANRYSGFFRKIFA